MKQLTAVFILVLASTNASKYFRLDHQFQQEPAPRNKYPDVLGVALDDDRFLSKLPSGDDFIRWESPPDPRMLLLSDLESLENFLQDDSNDYRIKRTKTSLSIDNPLDVLRQSYFRALARQMKYKSIERNREHLLKTGKRSAKDSQYLNKRSDAASAGLEDGLRDSGTRDATSNEPSPTTRRYQNRLEDLSYHT